MQRVSGGGNCRDGLTELPIDIDQWVGGTEHCQVRADPSFALMRQPDLEPIVCLINDVELSLPHVSNRLDVSCRPFVYGDPVHDDDLGNVMLDPSHSAVRPASR